MQELRIVLIILGAVVIAALFLHGLWTTKKEKALTFGTNADFNPNKLDDLPEFDKDGIGAVRVIKTNENATPTSAARREPTLFDDSRNDDPLFSVEKEEALPSIHDSLKDLSAQKEPEMAPLKKEIYFDEKPIEFDSQLSEHAAHAESEAMAQAARIHEEQAAKSVPKVDKPLPKIHRRPQASTPVHPPKDEIHPPQPTQPQAPITESKQPMSFNTLEFEETSFDTEPFEAKPQAEPEFKVAETKSVDVDDENDVLMAPEKEIAKPVEDAPKETPKETQNAPKSDVLMISVQMRNQEFKGRELVNCLEQFGMLFGEMDIFHRHADLAGTGKILFSAANMFNPGSFPMATIHQFTTQGLTFFMTLPCYGEAEQNFKLMLQTAQQVADLLGGDVTDDQRNLMTPKRLDQYKERIKGFYESA